MDKYDKIVYKIIEIRPKIETIVKERLDYFKKIHDMDDKIWFSELAFCILTANTSAEMGIRIQNSISPDEFASLSYEDLRDRLKLLRARFYNTRSKYIYENQKYANNIKKIIISLDENKRREWLIENIKGFDYKESSHFLRNVGFFDYAIIDKHIFNLMKEFEITDEEKVRKNNYIELENKLKILAQKLNMSLGELDLYLWYLKTGKVLK
ncbi:MAG: N-glycosylase/DNA lyase [Thermoplasmata archaeon]|jgi:N-glycosylase/DNA lyase